MSCGEHAAPQEALQLRRQKLELRAEGKGRRRLARALRMEEHGSADEVAREGKLMQAEQNAPMVDEADGPASVVVEVLNTRGTKRWKRAGGRTGLCDQRKVGLRGNSSN